MGRFLWGGGGFGGIIESFGHPAVHHWTGDAIPRAATRRIELIPAEADPAAVVAAAIDVLHQYAGTSGVHSTAVVVDPRHWEVVHYTLWEHAAPDTAGIRYQVLHLCSASARTHEFGGVTVADPGSGFCRCRVPQCAHVVGGR
jgi:hypothetical protein